jgi:Glycosyl hydrolase-like 10
MPRSIAPSWLGMFAACVLAGGWTAPLQAEVPKVGQTLLVHHNYDLSQAENRQALLEAGASRIIVPVLSGGETLHPTASTLFRQAERYRGKSDALRSLQTACRDKGVAVFVLLDCLQWVRPGAARDDDLLARHDELAERDATGGCGSVPVAGKYASPFHPRVRKALVTLVEEVADRYPDLDGVVLRCGLDSLAVLGFSESARAASIRALQVDPLQLRFDSHAEEDITAVASWLNWRNQQVTELVHDLAAAYRGKNAKGKLVGLGSVNFYRLGLRRKNYSAEDWLNWAKTGSINEVLLEGVWTDSPNLEALARSRLLADKLGRPLRLTPVILLQAGSRDVEPRPALDALFKQGRPADMVFMITKATDPPRLSRLREHPLFGGK